MGTRGYGGKEPQKTAELALQHIFHGQPAYEPDFRGKDEIDWDTNENPDLEAEDGLLHMNNIETRRVWDREFHLLDPGNLEGSGRPLVIYRVFL